MLLSPQLVVSAGMPAAGKTTTSRAICREVDNAVYFDRDAIISGGLLCVDSSRGEQLLPFSQYIGTEPTHQIETPFGSMVRLEQGTHYYFRHASAQSWLIAGTLAAEAMQLGKVAFFDCFLARDLNNGRAKRFMEWEIFAGFPVKLLYFVVGAELCEGRIRERAEGDPEARLRTKALREDFASELKANHTLNADGETFVREHGLMVDTTSCSTEAAVAQCIEYIAS